MSENETLAAGGAETQKAAPAADMPASKMVLKLPPAPVTPTALRLTPRPRDLARQAVADHQFAGNPKSKVVELARQLALALIDEHPEDVNGIEPVIEVGGGLAHQVNVIVIPHKW